MKINKKTSALLSMIGIVIIGLGLYAFKAHPESKANYTAQPRWENLEVLPQDISKDSLEHLMKNYATSLGVKCNYCHTPSQDDPTELDFPSDDKIEKEIARGMIKMTNEINATYFQPYFPDPKPKQVHVANCVMCHRGATNPEKYLSQMGQMYKTYEADRDNRKEKILEQQQKE
ncbi:MAG: c-type cytochrome [Flavobacteriaceae bacterium]|nr:c-type cytochrome [Psychroflexus sp.]